MYTAICFVFTSKKTSIVQTFVSYQHNACIVSVYEIEKCAAKSDLRFRHTPEEIIKQTLQKVKSFLRKQQTEEDSLRFGFWHDDCPPEK